MAFPLSIPRASNPMTIVYVLVCQEDIEMTDVRVYGDRDKARQAFDAIAEREKITEEVETQTLFPSDLLAFAGDDAFSVALYVREVE